MKRIFWTMVSRDARSGDSAAPTFSRFDGTATVASSLLISLTRRVFSATSCIKRSFSDDACDRLSILACTSGEGPCLHPAATSSARGSHAALVASRLLVNMSLKPPTVAGCPASHGCRARAACGENSTPFGATWFRRSQRVPRINNESHLQSTAMDVTNPGGTPPPPADRESSTGDSTYVLSRWLFLRLLGLVYLIAFGSLALQVTGLVGEHGILPATAFLERARALYGGAAYRLFPTVCWLGAGDGTLRLLCWGGGALALLVMAGVAQAPALALLWACYLSLSAVGQTFLWFQWDGLLLETGLLAILYAPKRWLPSRGREPEPSGVVRWLVWLLLFKLVFLSGITQLASGDRAWRHLTALDYHFWTQPLPPWTAWYAQQLPTWLRQGMTLGTFAIELGAPWIIFAPSRFRRLRIAGCALLVLGQLGIAVTGNYGFFNLLAIVLCVSLLGDAALRPLLRLRLRAGEPESPWRRHATLTLAAVIALLSALAFAREPVAPLPRGGASVENLLLRAVAPLRSVNGYGLFRVMTTERREIVIEGSADGAHWLEYEFPWKPGAVTRRPRFVAPHQPRLDLRMWFAALDPDGAEPLLAGLVRGLLDGSPEVLSLLDSNPFPAAPPRYVRLVSYRYRFTTSADRSRSGARWAREFVGYLTGAPAPPKTHAPPDSAAPPPPESRPPRRRRP